MNFTRTGHFNLHGLATFQGLNRHAWLVATTANRAALESSGPTSPRVAGPTRVQAVEGVPRTPAELLCMSAPCPHLILHHRALRERSRVPIQGGGLTRKKPRNEAC